MCHVNYKNWAKYVQSLFQFAETEIKNIIDISCGTGSFLTHFDRNKYSYWGSDFSFPMVIQARNKIGRNVFLNSDAKNIAVKSDYFDAVIFLYDSVNYLKDEEQLNNLFVEVKRILVDGGIFIFDIITDILCRTYYKNFEEEENWGENGYIRHSFYNEIKHLQYNEFRIRIGDKVYFENHIQKVFSEELIAETIRKNGFVSRAQFDDFTFHQSNNNSERIHYVCVKK
jgi:ubiquinone/menaquinone biosynthesis C-methylase UbiE